MKMGHSTRKWMMGNPEVEKSLVELERQNYWGLLPARLAVNWIEGWAVVVRCSVVFVVVWGYFEVGENLVSNSVEGEDN